MSPTRSPQHIGDIAFLGSTEAPQFYFSAWAAANAFDYPPAAKNFLSFCGSAAEAFFARPFTQRDGARFGIDDGVAVAGDLELKLQERCAGYWIDAVVTDLTSHLAIEIDGAAWHHRTREQLMADYARQRRIVLKGYTVVRFTAHEAFSDPDECWRQVELILAARRCV